MRLCVITDEISQNVAHALSVMVEYGCTEAELRNVYNTYIVDADNDLLQRVENDLKQAGMTVPCIDTPLFKCDLPGVKTGNGGAVGPVHNARNRTSDEQMHLLQRAIDLCKRFDAPFIRIFSFWKQGSLTPDIEDRIADALVRPCEVAARAGVTLLLENEHSCYLGTGKETARVIEKVGSPALKMVWDPGNAYMAGEQPFPSGYASARAHTIHLHIKDAHASAEGKLEWTVVGEGDIDYLQQFAALKADGYSGSVSLETHYRGPNNNAEEASRLCLAGLKRLIEMVG
jgi:sugar phosphate isomerase/epimerase